MKRFRNIFLSFLLVQFCSGRCVTAFLENEQRRDDVVHGVSRVYVYACVRARAHLAQIMCVCVCVCSRPHVLLLLQLKVIPGDAFLFRLVLLGFVAANFLVVCILEVRLHRTRSTSPRVNRSVFCCLNFSNVVSIALGRF